MTDMAMSARELSRAEIEAVSGGLPDIPTTPPEMPWVPGEPFPTGTGPYGGDDVPIVTR